MAGLFLDLNAEQEVEFRQWARDNYTPGDPIKGIWHPVVQDECVRINKETFENPSYVEKLAQAVVFDPVQNEDQ